MNVNEVVSEIEFLHVNRDFAPDIIDIDPIIDSYRKTHLPNECIYVVDCRKAELMSITHNEDQVLNLKGFRIQGFASLYEHAHLHVNELIAFNKKLVEACFDPESGMGTQDVCSSIYTSSGNATIYKRTALLAKDRNGNVLYTVGSLINATGTIPRPSKLQTEFLGPNGKRIYAQVNGIQSFEHILSGRELQVLLLIRDGYNSRQISEELFISKNTVSTHRKHILKKFESKNALEALKKAQSFGLI